MEALITPSSGQLEATGASRPRYLLDQSAGSVVMDTLIRMTSVKNVSGLPLEQSQTAWTVQLEPEGLPIPANASLTIQFPTPPPILEQIPFQDQGDGQAFSPTISSQYEFVAQLLADVGRVKAVLLMRPFKSQ